MAAGNRVYDVIVGRSVGWTFHIKYMLSIGIATAIWLSLCARTVSEAKQLKWHFHFHYYYLPLHCVNDVI